MTLTDQVCSLEQAKELKSLGVKQESYAFWHEATNGTVTLINRDRWLPVILAEIYAAFTVAELGEMLPIKVGDNYHEIETCHEGTGEWKCSVYNVVSGKRTHSEVASSCTEANARAKMLVYLLENRLITP